MAYRLFQNSNKTQPITEAGVSVGYSERKQGTVDALQATTLSKPLLGRWPKGGRRNIADGASGNGWPNSGTSAGLSFQKDAYYTDTDGIPVTRYRLNGTVSGNGQVGFGTGPYAEVPVGQFSASTYARVLSGLPDASGLSGGHGVRVQAAGSNASGGWSEGSLSTVGVKGPEWQRISVSHTFGAPATIRSRIGVVVHFPVGTVVTDLIYEIKAAQYEVGPVATAPQINYGPNNITEPGVEDEWFLYNDGNDSLNTQPLQLGDFSVTSVDIYGNMDNKPIVNSSGGSINSLVKERQRDVIVRSPPLTPSELEQVQAYWKAKGYKTEWSPLLLMSTQTDGHWSRGYNPNID